MMGLRDLAVRLALALGLLLPAYFAVAALGTKFGLFNWQVGFGVMTYRLGSQVTYATLAVAVVALVLALAVTPRRGIATVLVALVIPLVAIGYGYHVRSQSGGVPPIHDVTTNALNPPPFGAQIMAIRQAGNANPVVPPTLPLSERAYFKRISAVMPERAGAIADQTVAEIVSAAYPDVGPIELSVPPGRAFELATLEARAQGWEIHLADDTQGLLNATAETFWFGFKDDVSVRVNAGEIPGTSVVDMRSISRVGGGDMGANAHRIRVFRDGLTRRAE